MGIRVQLFYLPYQIRSLVFLAALIAITNTLYIAPVIAQDAIADSNIVINKALLASPQIPSKSTTVEGEEISSLNENAITPDFIHHPELLYRLPLVESNPFLQQHITVNRHFSNIDDVVKEINYISGLKAFVLHYNDTYTTSGANNTTGITIHLANATLQQFIQQVSMALEYNFTIQDNQVIFNGMHQIASSNNSLEKPLITAKPNAFVNSTYSRNYHSINNAKNILNTWSLLASDHTLHSAISKWCAVAHWQLIWDVKADYPIVTTWVIHGDFDYAINEVLKASMETNVPLVATMYDANHVLKIHTLHDSTTGIAN